MALDTRILNLASAEEFVARTKNARWEGWDIVMFNPKPRATMVKDGVYNRETGQWGFETRISPNDKGLYRVMVHRHTSKPKARR